MLPSWRVVPRVVETARSMEAHTEAVALSSSTKDAIVSPVNATAMDLGIARAV